MARISHRCTWVSVGVVEEDNVPRFILLSTSVTQSVTVANVPDVKATVSCSVQVVARFDAESVMLMGMSYGAGFPAPSGVTNYAGALACASHTTTRAPPSWLAEVAEAAAVVR